MFSYCLYIYIYIYMYNTINVYEEFTADSLLFELTEEAAAASSLAVCLFSLSLSSRASHSLLRVYSRLQTHDSIHSLFIRSFVRSFAWNVCPLSLFINLFCPSYVWNKAKRKIHNTEQSKESSGAIYNSIVSRASSVAAAVVVNVYVAYV